MPWAHTVLTWISGNCTQGASSPSPALLKHQQVPTHCLCDTLSPSYNGTSLLQSPVLYKDTDGSKNKAPGPYNPKVTAGNM